MARGKGKISAKALEEKFDDGKENILQYFDTNIATRRIPVDIPGWMFDSVDNEAKHLGVSRQAVIKFWINEKIREVSPKPKKPARTTTP